MIKAIKEMWCILFHRDESLYYDAWNHHVGCHECDGNK